MELLTVDFNNLLMSHLEQCPLWGMYTEGFSEEVRVALNHKTALEFACGPYYIAADFHLAGGLRCEGFVVVSEMGLDIYALFIWTGKDFCPFNKYGDRLSNIATELVRLNDEMETHLTPEEVFPIQYELRLTKAFIDDLDLGEADSDEDDIVELKFGSTGIFDLPE